MKPTFYAILTTSDPEFSIHQEFTGCGFETSTALADLISSLAHNYTPCQLQHLFAYGTLQFFQGSKLLSTIGDT